MSSEPCIEFRGVSKIFSTDIDRARKNTLIRILFSPFLAKDRLLSGEVYLFRDLTFNLARGERIAVLMAPGTGKTTLLNMLLGLSPPTCGNITARGRVRLIQGRSAAERPLMYLRNYIRTLASLCGADWKQLDTLADEVLQETGTESSAETRIKNVDPQDFKRVTVRTFWKVPGEVFLFDDLDYRLEPISEEVLKGKALVYTTSSVNRIPAEIERCLVFHAGTIVFDGPTAKAKSVFAKLPAEAPPVFDLEALKAQVQEWERLELDSVMDPGGMGSPLPKAVEPVRKGTGVVRVQEVRFRDAKENFCSSVPLGASFEIVVGYKYEGIDPEGARLTQVTVVLEDETGRRVAGFPSEVLGFEPGSIRLEGELSCRIGSLPVLPGKYLVTVSLSVDGELADKSVNQFSFEVEPGDPYGTGKMPIPFLGPVWLPYSWSESDTDTSV